MKKFYEYTIALAYEWAVPIVAAVAFWSTFIAMSWAFKA